MMFLSIVATSYIYNRLRILSARGRHVNATYILIQDVQVMSCGKEQNGNMSCDIHKIDKSALSRF